MKEIKKPPRNRPTRAHSTDRSNIRSALAGVRADDVILDNSPATEKYLLRNSDLSPLMKKVCSKVRNSFPAAELALTVYQDPETQDEYLVLYVRESRYELGILERIDAATAEFAPQFEMVTGDLLVTTDFRKPRSNHAL